MSAIIELEKKAFSENEILPLEITEPRAISGESQAPKIEDFPLDKLMQNIDQDRMDILETLVRVTMIETEMILLDGISALRMWEHLARSQLSGITSPGQLFSPFEIPEDW